MIRLISLILIFCIIFFFITYNRKSVLSCFFSNKKLHNKKPRIVDNNNFNKSRNYIRNLYTQDKKVYSSKEKAILRKEMFILFQGTKYQKIEALNIANNLSDKSTLSILKKGLKDMDSDVVKISASLIEKFK